MAHILNADKHGPEVQKAAVLFEYEYFVNPNSRQIGASFARLAQEMLGRVNNQDELVIGLHKLREARDVFVQGEILDRSEEASAARSSGGGLSSSTFV